MTLYQLGDHAPQIDASAFVADTANVIGKVTLGAVLHTDPGYPLDIGSNVTIGHQAMLHGCTIGDGALVGIQAVILNGAKIGKGCLVGAGALVTEGKEFPDNMLILGSPAKAVRALTADDITRLQGNAVTYVQRGQLFNTQLKKIG